MNKWVKALVILIVLFFLFVPLVIATKYIALTQLYYHFVSTISNLTGLNQYLINAGVVLMMVPLYFGIRMFFSLNRQRRLIGISLLAAFFILYNIGLYQLTKDVQFSFSDGRTMKWYALTPEGVKFYDRSGVEPGYGIQLKPVTPEVIRNLKLIEKGEFNPVDPEKAIWFNPTTGDPQIWYYQSAGGSFEFFNKPGYHPLTGETLKPVNKQIHFEWLEKRKKGELRYSGKSDNADLKQKTEKKDETREISKAATKNAEPGWKIRYAIPGQGYSNWEDASVEKNGSHVIIRTVSNGRQVVFDGKEENGEISGYWKQNDPPYRKGAFFFTQTESEMEGYVTDFQEGEKKFPFQLKKF